MNTRNRTYKPGPEGKRKKFKHSPFEFEHPGKITGSCNRQGRITIRQDGDDGEYDEVIVPASLIYKIITLLEATRSFEWVDEKDFNPEE